MYLTSRYPTIPLQLLHLAAQYILSVISSLVAGETSGLGQGLCLALKRDLDENALRVRSVVMLTGSLGVCAFGVYVYSDFGKERDAQAW